VLDVGYSILISLCSVVVAKEKLNVELKRDLPLIKGCYFKGKNLLHHKRRMAKLRIESL
jgi:hypothetical protein